MGPPELPPDDMFADEEEVKKDPPIPPELEAQLITLLQRPKGDDEGHAEAAHAKEMAMRAALMPLTAIDAFSLQRRIQRNEPGDELATLFKRLLPERQYRLVRILVEIRRRASIQGP